MRIGHAHIFSGWALKDMGVPRRFPLIYIYLRRFLGVLGRPKGSLTHKGLLFMKNSPGIPRGVKPYLGLKGGGQIGALCAANMGGPQKLLSNIKEVLPPVFFGEKSFCGWQR